MHQSSPVRQTFQFKLMAARRQKHLHRMVNLAGEIWNHSIAIHRTYYRIYGRYLQRTRLQAHIAKLKHRRFPEWNALNSQAIQQVADRIDAGYSLFFDSIKRGRKRARPPTFRKRDRFRSFTLKQTGWKLGEGGRITIQGRLYRFHLSRPVVGAVKTVTVKRDALGDFWIFLSCDNVPVPEPKAVTGQSAGFDFGLRSFLMGNDGTRIENPQFLISALGNMRIGTRAIKRKKRGSNGRRRATKALARIYRRLANLRDDWQWKEANKLVQGYDELVFETLEIDGMKSRWGRKVSDLAFGSFLSKVSWLSAKHGRVFTRIDRYEPTTKRCSVCQHIQPLTLDVRRWKCTACSTIHDRDQNAAINILEAGRGLRRESEVSPAPQAALVMNAKSPASAWGVRQKTGALPLGFAMPDSGKAFVL
jgi:putative transposase